MTWLETQDCEVLKTWIRKTATPMLVTLPDGSILWVNEAFEGFLGYTNIELAEMTWKEITADKQELKYDVELVEQIARGERTDYQLQKAYRHKSGTPRQCVIDVLRYPQKGEFECFLVAVCPVDHGVQFALEQISEIRTILLKLMESPPSGVTWEKLVAFAKDHPVVAAIVSTLAATLLFGERVVEVIKMFGIGVNGQ